MKLNKFILNFIDSYFKNLKKRIIFKIIQKLAYIKIYIIKNCLLGEIGRRGRLKIYFYTEYWFDSNSKYFLIKDVNK